MKIGIDLGGSHIAIGVIDDKGYIVEKAEKRLLSKDKKDIKTSIETYIVKNVKELMEKYKIKEIGIAVPGTIKSTEIIKSVNLGVKNYNLVENLKKEINLPIKIRNDAKCAAIAENKMGALKDYKRSIFLSLGTGIGGAVIINNELLDTGDLSGCEFGHMIIQKDGIRCNCGKKGCFEKYASMKALKTNLRDALGLDENTRGQELLDMLRKNKDNYVINKIVDEYIEYLSIGISNLIDVFEPEAVCLGGSFVYFADVLLEKLKNNNYIIASVGNGLFTTGGHYIMIYGVNGNNLKIYDPFLYKGKFDTSTRRGKAYVDGDTVICSTTNFKNYANYKRFFCYKYNRTDNSNENKSEMTSYTRFVRVSSRLNIRSGAGIENKIIGKLNNNERVTVYETKGNWSRIGENKWVSSDYLAEKSVNVNRNTVGQYKRLKNRTYLYSKSNLTGKKYTYLAKTQVKIIRNVSSNIDYVYVVKTGRYAYIRTNAYK